MSSDIVKPAIERFVANLWMHVQLRSRQGDPATIERSAKRVRQSIEGVDTLKYFEEIGESLAAYILNLAIKDFGHGNCLTCSCLSSCNNTDLGSCDKYEKDVDAYNSELALFTESVMRLDGVFGIDAQEMLSVIHRFLEGNGFNDLTSSPP